MRKLAERLRRLRRGSSPHEITLFLPVFAILFVTYQVKASAIPLWSGMLISISTCVISGVWLGIAWKNPRPTAVALRTVYMGILVAEGYALSKHPPNMNKESFVRIGLVVTEGYGSIFYLGWMLGIIVQGIGDNILYPTRHLIPVRSLTITPRGATLLRRLGRRPRYWYHNAYPKGPTEGDRFDIAMGFFVRGVFMPGIVLATLRIIAQYLRRHL